MYSSQNSAVAPGRQRWRIPVILAVTVVIAYLDRMNISLALPLIAKQFHWDAAQTRTYGSLLLSLFYFGYGLSSLLLTPFAARLGSRRGIILIICLASCFTALGAVLSQFILLFAVSRVLLGVVEGPHFPLSAMAIKHWFPANERSRANSILFAGLFLAVIAGPILLVPIMDQLGWRAAFLSLSVIGLALSIPLSLRFLFDTPEQDPGLSDAEARWIKQQHQTQEPASAATITTYPLYLFRRPDFLLLIIAATLNNIVAIGLTSWIPIYFTTVRNVAYEQLAWIVSLPYVAGLLGLLFWSQLGDRSNRRGLCAAIGYALLTVMIYVSLTTPSFSTTLIAMSLAIFCASAYTSCEYAFAQRIIPAKDIAAGTGLFSGLSIMIGGSLAPIAASSMLDENGGYSLWLLMALAAVIAVVMFCLGRLKRY